MDSEERQPSRSGRGRGADDPTEIPLRGWRDIVVRVREQMGEDRTTLLASGIAFHGFLSLIPGLAAVVAIYGLFRTPTEARAQLADLFESLPDSVANLLTEQAVAVAEQSSVSLSLTALGSIAGALWAASGAVGQLMSAVGAIYDDDEDRSWFRRKAMALATTAGLLIVAVMFVGAIALTDGLGGVIGVLATAALYALAAAGLIGALAGIYRVGPDRSGARPRWLSLGAAVAVGGWVLATILFQFYVTNLGSYQETYGALGAVAVLLLWLWLSAVMVLVGAHVNAEVEHQTAVDTTVDGDQPIGDRGAHVADTVGRAAS